MLSTFPAPVLSVTADAVRDLEGRDALSGLWALFTKCKESIKDGHRLENISWRLWHRELTAVKSYCPPTPESESCALSDDNGRFSFFPDISPRYEIPQRVTHRSVSPNGNNTHEQSLTRSCRRAKPSTSVGKIICDMLPQTLAPISTSTASRKGYLPSPETDCGPSTNPPLPTPTSEVLEINMSPTVIPSVCLPSTPPESESTFPRVVVVNPTPNPTPHPTPPATPTLPIAAPSFVPPPSTHLLPPSSPSSSLIPASSKTELPPPTIPPHKLADETLKASDRRFFLHHSPDADSPDREPVVEPEVVDLASSTASSHLHTKASVESKRPFKPRKVRDAKGKEVKSKELARRAPMRTSKTQIGRPPQIRRATTGDAKARPTFNIGSTSSNGSKATGTSKSGSKDSMPGHKAPPSAKEIIMVKGLVMTPPQAHPTAPAHRRIILTNTSSEYETTDTEDGDDSWASEDMNLEDNAKVKEEVRLREAALEVQRQMQLFAKLPKRSYSNLNRTQSGLLSQLMNPDPTIFPPNHPYRTTHSSQDITRLPRASMYAPPGLHASKSAFAIPVAAQVNAQSIPHQNNLTPPANPSSKAKAKANPTYRPKGRPHGLEMEDDSDSADNSQDVIQVSKSIAQQKLAALVGRRTSDTGPSGSGAERPPPVRRAATMATTAPIALGHPYNLPPPAPPSTPRTTRRQMLATEMSESLRRNLLWERKVSNNVTTSGRRRTSGALGSGLRPLTSTTSIVQVTAKTTDAVAKEMLSRSGDELQRDDSSKHRATMRSHNSADDFHYAGW